MLDVSVPVPFVHRVVMNGGVAYGSALAWERANFLNIWNLVTVTNTTSYRLFSSIKLRKIEVWCPVSAGAGVTEDFGVEYTSAYGAAKTLSGVSEGSAVPGHFVSSPPKDSVAGFWSIVGTNESEVVIYLWGPTGTTFDLHFTGRLLAEGTALISSNAPNAGTPGAIYVKSSSATFVPTARAAD
jgi:hypothetical protein